MNYKKFTLLFAGLAMASSAMAQIPVYLDETKPLDERVSDALGRMTMEEKVRILHAQSKFSSAGVPRLGIPEMWFSDGPHGVRVESLWDEWAAAGWTSDSCTAYPALTCLASTWDRGLALRYGRSIGEEARYREKDVLLGPGVNIMRTPLGGRNFEYMGEDPFLTSEMVVPYVKGVQENGVAACLKHFALNNQEKMRASVNVSVDDRALYEIYFPAFKAAIQKGGAWAVMSAYNQYRGDYCSQNRILLKGVLRHEWGFDGVVLSDWGGVHETQGAVFGGLDMEFGTGTDGLFRNTKNAYDNYWLASPYLDGLRMGEYSEEELDEKAGNVLRLIFRTAMNTRKPFGSMNSPRHSADARAIAENGIVLLKNDGGLLPVAPSARKIVVVGENAIKRMTVGGGSSSLKARYEITPLEGIKARFGAQAEVVFARGYVGDTASGYAGVGTGQDIRDARSADELIAEAVEAARGADYVIFVGGLNKSIGQDCEGYDRESLSLPYGQDKVVEALAKVNSDIVFVNVSGNPVSMPWIGSVPAVVQAWYLGSEAGNAIASVLSGDVNPSGKLPFTFPVRLEDVAAHSVGQYPGEPEASAAWRSEADIVPESYDEGIFTGYRWFDTEAIKPLFAFGHGLSYTTFKYGKPVLDRKSMLLSDTLKLSVRVTNTGKRKGQETVQLYIHDVKSSLSRPLKELKGFSKVCLAPGESATVTFCIDKDALSYFDDARHEWVAEPGVFEALVGASSSDIRGKVSFELQEEPKTDGRPSYKVLCLGNSITRHAYAKKVEWYSDWGMAASCPENDYCHVLEKLLCETFPGSKVSPLNIAKWERSLSSDIGSYIGEQIRGKDIVVIRLGENVRDEEHFEAALDSLAAYCVKKVPYVLITGTFWKSEVKEKAIMAVAKKYGIPYYSIAHVDAPENHPHPGDTLYDVAGERYPITKEFIITHPNDSGMREIAEVIAGGIKSLVGKSSSRLPKGADRVREYIADKMPMSTRTRKADSLGHIGLPYPFSVPQAKGTTFMDLFYWDTYYTNLGLLSLGDVAQAKNNVDDILYMIDRYGYMPNSANTNHLNRSQPPYASMMVRDVYERTGDKEWLRRAVAVLEKEYDFWMHRRITPTGLSRHFNSASRDQLLGFYKYLCTDRFPNLDVPRPDDEKVRIASQYLSEAETGWDFTPRFSGCEEDYNPVDLNANLYLYEKNFAWFFSELGLKGAKSWDKAAESRRKLIVKLCLNPADGLFYDYNYVTGCRSHVYSSAVFNLLWAGIPSKAQAEAIVRNLHRLECSNGLAACEAAERDVIYQWDYPNAWASFNALAVIGLDRYGFKEEAARIASKYVTSVASIYNETHQLWEKYNAVSGDIDVKDEYKMPGDFMGWTAGAFLLCYDYLGFIGY